MPKMMSHSAIFLEAGTAKKVSHGGRRFGRHRYSFIFPAGLFPTLLSRNDHEKLIKLRQIYQGIHDHFAVQTHGFPRINRGDLRHYP
jgi:hypothetical protein